MTTNSPWMGALPFPAAAPQPVAIREPKKTIGYRLVFLLWMVFMFEPQWLLANKLGVIAFAKITTILAVAVFATLVLRFRMPKLIVPPLGAIALFALLTYRLAVAPHYAEGPAIQMGVYYLLAVGLATFVKTPKQAIPLITALLVWQFAWWGALGVATGRVGWHPLYGNYDGYGPLVVLGVATAYHYGMAVTGKKRLFGFAIALLCVAALVSTFARGAFLGLIAVLGWMWIRSPKKGWATVFGIAAVAGLVVSSSIFTGGVDKGRGSEASFFAEMQTIISEQASGSGTTGDRKILWGAAVEAWKENPLIGVGGNSFGPFAAQYFEVGDIGGDYGLNPLVMYDRKLHSIYYQILAEFGLIGSLLYVWLLWDFFRRNAKLRSPEFVANWKARGGGALNLQWVALGLTGALVAFLANGIFYNLLECTFLSVTVAMNGLLFELAKPAPQLPLRRS